MDMPDLQIAILPHDVDGAGHSMVGLSAAAGIDQESRAHLPGAGRMGMMQEHNVGVQMGDLLRQPGLLDSGQGQWLA